MTLTGRALAEKRQRHRLNQVAPAKGRSVRAGKGLGDSLYLQSIVRHLVQRGETDLEVCTSWPDVFRPLRYNITISPFRRVSITASYHYISRKRFPETDQFTDCCLSAAITEKIEFKLDWTPTNAHLIDKVKASGRPVVMLQLPRDPMGRADRFGEDLLPDCRTIQRAIDLIGSRAFIVQVGAGKPLHRFNGIHLDLANKTSVCDLLNVASVSSGALGYCSFIAPLAESFSLPMLLVWSVRGLNSTNPFIRAITPNKIFHRPETSTAVRDDCTDYELGQAADAFCQQIGGG